ncbi:MAG: OmpA family protein [Pseudomonadota bacterium]|nr:OmpA family protein [Pseudomonadota bacterium]
MTTLKKASLLAAIGALLAPAAVFADDLPHDVVKDARGNVVLSSDGNCVITKWQSNADECNGVRRGGILSKLTREQRTVHFGFNKSTLDTNEKAKLDEVSQIIMDSKEVQSVDIVGYADPIGKSSYNKKLSERRAETVKHYLAAKGLKTRKVRVEGLGETDAFAKCDPKMPRDERIACLAPDRRVEIQLNLINPAPAAEAAAAPAPVKKKHHHHHHHQDTQTQGQ